VKVSIALVSALAVAAAASSARATVLTGPVDTIYSDNFAAPVANVNGAGVDPNAIVGNAPAVSNGLDGGSAAATYLSTAPVSPTASPTTTPDANWDYSGSGSAKITAPAADVVGGESTKNITNLTLPLVPVVGMTYDFSLTMNAPAATGAHGLFMAFVYNNGNGHNTAPQAVSNNNPIGLVLLRDAVNTGTAGVNGVNGYFDIFESTGTGSDNEFNPTANAATGGTPGTTLTVDEVFTPLTDGSTGTEAVYIGGVQIAQFNLTGIDIVNTTTGVVTSSGITDIQFGDNRDASATVTNFSLTAQAVPEPASLGLIAVGAMGLLARRRR
jgi:PEP-CTERM motif